MRLVGDWPWPARGCLIYVLRIKSLAAFGMDFRGSIAIVLLSIACFSGSWVYADEINPRKSFLAGYLAWFWCIQRTQGDDEATRQRKILDPLINLDPGELGDEYTIKYAIIVYENSGLSSLPYCPNASSVSTEERNVIKGALRRLLPNN